jgi:hypothetical protein
MKNLNQSKWNKAPHKVLFYLLSLTCSHIRTITPITSLSSLLVLVSPLTMVVLPPHLPLFPDSKDYRFHCKLDSKNYVIFLYRNLFHTENVYKEVMMSLTFHRVRNSYQNGDSYMEPQYFV